MKNIILLLIVVVSIGVGYGQKERSKGNQRAFYESSDPLTIDSTLIDVKPNALYFQFNTQQKPKDLKTMSFVWLGDAPKGYFTAYLVNTTDSIFNADRQDGSLIMIQEAIDKNGDWQPIEYWVYSGCGNSYFSPLKLPAGKCVMVPIKKYEGSYKTKIRLKFKIGKQVIYSGTFDGAINLEQFKRETESVNGILYHGPASYLDDRE
ncbi:MAG: hypothetical protein N4A35_02455 [Flavobacteriales bacterium]|jgi:hypothetical protein|nr:hypothetical protein [Flavobacteriales bacterium]